MASELQIVEIVKIIDTREYVEDGDRWVAIPGSGIDATCARCGKAHEVHATVLLSDGTSEIVGTGCAKMSCMDSGALARKITKADRKAKRLASMKAELCTLTRRLANRNCAVAAVAQMTIPKAEVVKTGTATKMAMGSACVYVQPWADNNERRSTLERMWADKEAQNICGVSGAAAVCISCKIDDLMRRIDRAA